MAGRAVIAVILLASLDLAGCQTTRETQTSETSTPQRLSAAEIEDALVGNTLVRRGGGWFSSWEYNGLHSADGSILGRVTTAGGEERVTGDWDVTGDDLYCRTWSNHWGGGKRGCFRVSRAGDSLIFEHVSGSSGGAERYAYHWRAGKPEDM